MYLENWQLFTFFIVFVAGMIHVGRSSYKQGVMTGAEATIDMFEDQGYLKTTEVEEEGIINVYFHKPTGFKPEYETD